MIHSEKTLRAIGMTTLFFQHSCHMINANILKVVNIFLKGGKDGC